MINLLNLAHRDNLSARFFLSSADGSGEYAFIVLSAILALGPWSDNFARV